MLKGNNLLSFLVVGVFLIWVFFSITLLSYIPFWLKDIHNCYIRMPFIEFVFNHLHIFIYLVISIFSILMLLKGVYHLVKETTNSFHYYRNLQRLTLKRYRRLVVIDTDEPVSLNLFGKIYISTGVLRSFNRSEKRAIFNHEIGHLVSMDSFKYILVSVLLSFFPGFFQERLYSTFVLISEISADIYSSSKVGVENLSIALLKTVETRFPHPAGSNMVKSRINFLLGEEKVKIPTEFIWGYFAIVFLTAVVLIFKTCFCGVM